MSTQTATRPVTIDYGCPDWCERTDHDADRLETGEVAVHYAAQEGRYISVQGQHTPLGLTVDEWVDMSAEDLRALAAEAIAVAEWLEARR